ncbi:MAG: exodeoxyribonuclease V subunit gamma [Candidatus Thiodiazotropha lotti]|nr:exodeoxyribonuclease V subunit gamma [Candidatus Thiodiazotropha lotti]MCW4220849.1 exodeoxyribonuclease V subunit gamma [Candidatus Thiodiazotropha lotti]
MLRLYQSNQLEILARQLAEVLATPALSPLQSEQIVVQHPGMGRWLSQRIASQLGISANLEFPLPANFLWQLFEQLLPDVPHQDSYQPKHLAWRIHQLLASLSGQPDYAAIGDYLSDGGDLRRFQLSQQLARLFDQYLLYRPDWIHAWQAGESAVPGDHWQADLWRKLVDQESRHWVHFQQQLFQSIDTAKPLNACNPRVCIFGVPSLSPGYLEIIRYLANWIDVHLFLVNPCQAHWAEIVTPEEQARFSLAASGEDLYLDLGHPLLATLGRQGRDFFAAINEMDPGSEEAFTMQPDASLLHRLQNQILNLEPPETGAEADDSISFQLCHSPMREAEVLYDQLLAALDDLPGLRPDEILVMTTDIERYAPLLEAVFAAPGERPKIPYRISDHSIQRSNPLAEGLLSLLSLPGSRYGVTELLALLEQAAVRARFGLDEAGLEKVTQWLQQASIRWGRDGANKVDFGLPEEDRNTWRAGLRQLMLGYALADHGESLWRGVYPLDAVEGSDSQWLGGLLAFTEAVFELESVFAESATPLQWQKRLTDTIERFFAVESNTEQDLIGVRSCIEQLVEETGDAGYQASLSLALVRHRLSELFEQPVERGFLGGGVNICALAPMRSLPFRVICLLGMNDGQFPRQPQDLGFDLMRREFRNGDRSRRVDDRYLFLETLLSARQRLIISYCGQSQRDNMPMPASVVVEELRDCLQQMVGETGLARISQRHPLQPFSPDYFRSGSDLFSYSTEMREAAMTVGRGRAVDLPLVEQPLPATESQQVIELDQLIQFFENPQRQFARLRLGINLEAAAQLPEERERFAYDRFEQSDLEHQMVDLLLQEQPAEPLFELFDGRGLLPHGQAGRLAFEAMLDRAQSMSSRVADCQGERLEAPLVVEIPFEQNRLSGYLRTVNQSGLLVYNTAGLYPYHLLRAWIRHLVLNQLRPEGVSLETRLLEAERDGRFTPVDQPEEHLQKLMQAYQTGMQTPLPFYPGTSWQFVERYLQGDPEKAQKEAERKWFGSSHHSGDASKPYNQLLYQGHALNHQAFSETSLTLLQPLMQHLEWQ